MKLASVAPARGGFPIRVLLLALALAAPMAAAHAPADCSPSRAFPSAAGIFLAPGAALAYYVPDGQFITVANAMPVDVALAGWGDCAQLGCDVHDATGVTACAARDGKAAVEIANRGTAQVYVQLTIGICLDDRVCDGMG